MGLTTQSACNDMSLKNSNRYVSTQSNQYETPIINIDAEICCNFDSAKLQTQSV